MSKKNEEKKPLTLFDKWNRDSEDGICFDDSEWTGEYIEIQRPNEDKKKKD
jgi:hypothetical protein